MPQFLSKLTSCIHRRPRIKKICRQISSSSQPLFKLSRFELMPDELIGEIAQYIPLVDLFNGFVDLNFRINLILRDIRLGVVIHQGEDRVDALNYFRKQIVYIHVDRYPLLNLKIFPNLRSLIIYLPTRVQLLSICPLFLANLCRLWIGIINRCDQLILCNTLFGSDQFVKLQYCNLFEINLNKNLYLFQSSSINLRTLLITNCTTKDFILLLSVLPNLYRLEICLSNVFSSTIFKNLTNYYHQELKILKIEFAQSIPQLNILNSLISFVPHVQRCTLLLDNLIQIKDYAHLEYILVQNLLYLREFYCSIDYSCQLSSNEMIPKFDQLRLTLPFFQTMRIIPCAIHEDKCVRKTWMNKTLIPI